MSRKRLWTRAPQWSGALCKVIARDPVLVWRLGLREGRFGATNGREASIRSGGAPSHAGKVPSSGASDKKRPLHFRGMPHGRGNPRSPRAICNIFALTTARSSLSLSWRMVVSASQNARTCSPRAAYARANVNLAIQRRHVLLATPCAGVLLNPGQSGAAAQSIHDFTVQQYGEDVSMSKYKGEVLVVVNVASE
jgi:hypothetical protein